jgi:hypothetical protein
MATRRPIALLGVFGVVALLAGWVLFHVQRYRPCIHYEGLRPSGPCDPSVYLPFAWVGIALWVAASIALLIVATWLIGIGIWSVIRHDARVRAAQRER